jgi:hypothetical protein
MRTYVSSLKQKCLPVRANAATAAMPCVRVCLANACVNRRAPPEIERCMYVGGAMMQLKERVERSEAKEMQRQLPFSRPVTQYAACVL